MKEAIELLDRIERRLSSCNVGAGFNYVDVPELRAAYAIIRNCREAIESSDAAAEQKERAEALTHAISLLESLVPKGFYLHGTGKDYLLRAIVRLNYELADARPYDPMEDFNYRGSRYHY